VTAAFPTGLAGTDEGPWDATLTCNDGFGGIGSATTVVTVTNSPPVVSLPATRTYNLEYSPAATPQKDILATAADSNGDTALTWTWSVVSSPIAVTLANGNSGTAGFTPTAPGVYTLRATVCDAPASNSPYVVRPGDCGQATVVATVFPYIRPLGAVVDAVWRKSDDRLILVASAPSTLSIVNPAVDPTITPDPAASLGAIPVALSVKSDGTEAIVGETASHWQTVSLAGTPAASTLWTGPFTPTAVAHHGNRGFAINGSLNPPVYQLNTSTGTYGTVGCQTSGGAPCTPTGDRMASDANDLWILDASTNVSRYSVNNGNGDLTRLALVAVSPTATDLWRSSDPAYLFLQGTNGVKNATTLANVGSLPAGATQADSSLTLASIVGLAATGATVTTFGSSFELGPQTTTTLPHWGSGGDDRTLTAKYAFVSGDGTTANVVVQSSTPVEWGLYTFRLP